MKKSLRLLFTVFLTVFMFGFAMAQSSLTHSFSFKNGEAKDDVTGSEAEIMGEAYIDGTDLVLPGNGSFMDMSQIGIDINTYGALTLEVWCTAEAGVNTGKYTMIYYLGGSTNNLGSKGCFVSPTRGTSLTSYGAISTVNVSAPYNDETGVNGPECDDDVMHSLVLTIDDTYLKYYVDGELKGEGDLSVKGNSIAGLSNDFAYVGKGGYTGDASWVGTVHKFNIYNTALTEDEVAALKVDPNVGVGVKNIANKFKPAVSTNQNQINVSLSNTNSTKGSVEVFSLSGQKIKSFKFNNKTSLDMTQGMYIVKVFADNNQFTKKVVIK